MSANRLLFAAHWRPVMPLYGPVVRLAAIKARVAAAAHLRLASTWSLALENIRRIDIFSD